MIESVSGIVLKRFHQFTWRAQYHRFKTHAPARLFYFRTHDRIRDVSETPSHQVISTVCNSHRNLGSILGGLTRHGTKLK